MPNPGIVTWLVRHDKIFAQLEDAVTRTAGVAGRAGWFVDVDLSDADTAAALAAVRRSAQRLLAVTQRARRLAPIPDPDTATAFSAGVARWADAAETLIAATERRDVSEIHRAGRALDAGTAEFLRTAAALRRATGQQPDPANPMPPGGRTQPA